MYLSISFLRKASYMERSSENAIRQMSHLILVITIVGFTIISTILNFLMGWEKWTIPISVIAAVLCIIMHILKKPGERARLFALSIVLLIMLFYYCVNAEDAMHSSAVIAILLIVFILTQEILLTTACIITGYLGMIWNLVASYLAGEPLPGKTEFVHILFHFMLVLIAGVYTTGILRAIRKVDSEYNDNIERLELVNKSAGDFLANVSHEVRTPINAIVGLSGICIDKTDDEEIRNNLIEVRNAGRRVAEQIGGVLDFAEVDMDQVVVANEDYRVSALLSDIVNEVAPFKEKGLEIVIDVDPSVPAILNGDVNMIKKIMVNVISNGLKYSKEGGVYVRLSDDRTDYGINLIVEVRDTGIGMTSEEVEHIFERFYQADSGRARSASGLGLGMSIVAGFMKAIGGFVKIDSIPGKGTRVHLSIPQGVVDESECMYVRNRENLHLCGYFRFDRFENPVVREFYDRMVMNLTKGLKVPMHRIESMDNLRKLVSGTDITHLFIAEKQYRDHKDELERMAKDISIAIICEEEFALPEGSGCFLLKKPFYCFPVVDFLNNRTSEKADNRLKGHMYLEGVKALVVDDESLNILVAKGILKEYGIEVEGVTSGRDAIEACRDAHFDLIFMDYMMPGMDGIETMKIIRDNLEKEGIGKNVSFVALTANAVSAAKESFLNEGFDGFISKPIEISDLERTLLSLIPANKISYKTLEKKEKEPEVKAETVNEPVKEEKVPLSVFSLEGRGVDVQAGLDYFGRDEDFYKTVLLEVATEAEDKQVELDMFMDNNDIQNYEILVHALKSTSKMIGAFSLSEKALELEKAAKRDDIDFIKQNHQEMIREYENIVDGIADIFGEE